MEWNSMRILKSAECGICEYMRKIAACINLEVRFV